MKISNYQRIKNVKLSKYKNTKMSRYQNIKMSRYQTIKLSKMSNYQNIKIQKCQDNKTSICPRNWGNVATFCSTVRWLSVCRRFCGVPANMELSNIWNYTFAGIRSDRCGDPRARLAGVRRQGAPGTQCAVRRLIWSTDTVLFIRVFLAQLR